MEKTRQFTSRRKPDAQGGMNRLYVVENRYTLTGGMADHRLRIPASQIGAFAVALATEIGSQTKDATLQALVQGLPASNVKFQQAWITESAADLVRSRGKSLVLVGSRQPAAVQALVAGINAALGNLGKTLVGRTPAVQPAATIADVQKAIASGAAKTLVIIGGNPVYNAPADLEWGKLAALMRTPVLLDGRHMLDRERLTRLGYRYLTPTGR